ncbi:MAG: transcription antitermination factor NusB [Phycisphaeraceae bacterium]|nr:MAG: transcription antitermination factor NusB [Phycisphaeraceae bacterium]
MATPRDIRRLALVGLYQLDARRGEDADQIRETLDETIAHSLDDEKRDDEGTLFLRPEEPFTNKDKAEAFALATDAFGAHKAADTEFEALAPDWPPRRQAAIDRSILRLAHFEMVSGRTPPKVVVNEAVELAKAFSTDRSPAFINGLLGKVLKRVLGAAEPAPSLEGEHTDVTPLHLGGAAPGEASAEAGG